jgi:hypothetical protein
MELDMSGTKLKIWNKYEPLVNHDCDSPKVLTLL